MPSQTVAEANNAVLHCIEQSINDFNGWFPDISISTTTITYTINLIFNTDNIAKYFDDFDDFLVAKQTKKDGKRMFKNQISFLFKIGDKRINTKIFKNGSIHMTGCGDFLNAKRCLETLCNKLKRRKAVFVNGKFKEIVYVEAKPDVGEEDEEDSDNDVEEDKPITPDSLADELKMENIYNFCIRMINVCFNQDMCIDRKKLNELLRKNGHDSNFNQINPSVNVKYNVDGTPITIFVFQSGLITIAGTKSVEYLMQAYWFINNFILSHYVEVFTKRITPETIVDLLMIESEKEAKQKQARA
jgi:TATA-box binding protein (TBP) (component of TFIID and TFIIIB)